MENLTETDLTMGLLADVSSGFRVQDRDVAAFTLVEHGANDLSRAVGHMPSLRRLAHGNNGLTAVADTPMEEPVRGDDTICRSVSTSLREAPGMEGLELTGLAVQDGVVFLAGIVARRSAPDAARLIAEIVRGVEGVVEHLTVLEVDDQPSGDVR